MLRNSAAWRVFVYYNNIGIHWTVVELPKVCLISNMVPMYSYTNIEMPWTVIELLDFCLGTHIQPFCTYMVHW